MKSEVYKIAKIGNHELKQWVLENNGYYLKVLNYGATWQDWICNGESLLYQLPNLTDYLTNPYHVGHTIGRVAGRIKCGRFRLENQKYQLPVDENGHVVHSTTIRGFDSYFWDGEVIEEKKQISLLLTLIVKDDGFPGKMKVSVKYLLDVNGSVTIEYRGYSDQLTLFNPTTHVYFNLNRQSEINSQMLQINSKRHLEVDEDKIPTGQKIINSGGYDFSKKVKLEHNLAMLPQKELDTAFIVPANEIDVKLQGIVGEVTVESDRNAAVIFAANPLENRKEYTALAIEMQTLPDAINNEDFGDITLPADTWYCYKTQFKYNK